MALIVKVFVNNKLVAEAGVENVREVGALANYEGRAVSLPSRFIGESELRSSFKVNSHNKQQSPWALVEKMARQILKQEKKAP